MQSRAKRSAARQEIKGISSLHRDQRKEELEEREKGGDEERGGRPPEMNFNFQPPTGEQWGCKSPGDPKQPDL